MAFVLFIENVVCDHGLIKRRKCQDASCPNGTLLQLPNLHEGVEGCFIGKIGLKHQLPSTIGYVSTASSSSRGVCCIAYIMLIFKTVNNQFY